MAQRVVGREAELAVGETFLDAVPSAPVALILEGEAGIGKTTVWRELVEAASHRSYRVLRCQPAASEAKLSYSGISDLLGDAADDVLPLLPAPQREALEIALLRAEPRKGAGDPRTTATALLSALHELARKAPVVVAVDDVQWLDGPSARALEFAARRLGELPVALLLSLRTPHGPGVPLVLDRALPEDRLHRTPVGPLTLPALHRLLKKRLGFAPPRPTLIQIERAAGGNPFFALELARALPADGSRPPTGPLPVPETLRQVLEDRIAQLPAATRAALLVASALSDATVALVESATERTDARMLEAAEESGVIETEAGTVRFVHPLLPSLAYSLAPASERRRVHRRLGELVADVEQRARHLALSADGPDEEVAGALERAGEHAALRGAPDAAAELLEQARRLTPAEHVEDGGRRTVVAAEFHFHAGDRHRARTLLEEVLAGTPAGPVRADALRLLGEVRYHDDSFPEAIALFEEALEHVEDVPRLTAPIELGLVYAFVGAVNYPGAEPHARRALEQTEALGEPGLLAQALAVNALVDLFLGRGLDEDKLERALELEDVSRAVAIQLRPSMVAATLFFYSGQLDRAHALYSALHERVIERGEESHLPVLTAHMAWLQCWRGDFEAAAQVAREGLEASLLVGSERSEEHTSELQSHHDLVCRLLLEKKKKKKKNTKLKNKKKTKKIKT